MNVTMTHEELFDIIAQYEQVGFMQAVKAYEPSKDLVRETEVLSWLKMMMVDRKIFKRMVENGIITPIRLGTAKNSPRYFSKKEIKSAMAANNIYSKIRDCELVI